MERREHEVAGFRGGQRDFDRLAIAHFADEDDLRRLAQRRPQCQGEGRRIGVQLALVHRALLVVVQELDRILDGQDVIGAFGVDQIDDRRKRRGLARPGRTGHEHDAVLQRRAVGDRRRQAESWIDGIFCAIIRMTIANEPRWRKTLTRKRQRSGSAHDKSDEPCRQRAQIGFVVANQVARDAGGVFIRSAGNSAIGTVTSSPKRSTCGGRPGEKSGR